MPPRRRRTRTSPHRLDRSHDRVLGAVRMLARMLARRAVATADMPAGTADPEVDPAHSESEALLATGHVVAAGHTPDLDLVEVGAGNAHGPTLPRAGRRGVVFAG